MPENLLLQRDSGYGQSVGKLVLRPVPLQNLCTPTGCSIPNGNHSNVF